MKKLNKPKEVIPEGKIVAGFEPDNHKASSNSFNMDNNFNDAIRLINNGNLNSAKDLLNKILKFHPEHRDSIKALSNIYLKTNKNESAIKLIFNYLKNNPDDSVFTNLMGVCLNSIGEIKLAEAFLSAAFDFSDSGPEYLTKFFIASMLV
jgi:predicted Zn-dependent protease